MTGSRGSRPPRQVREGDRDGVRELVGQPAQARPEDDPDRRDEIGPRPDCRRQGIESDPHLGTRDLGRHGREASRKLIARQGTNTGMLVAPVGQYSARRDRSKDARTLM